jgi:TolA-binding protein
LTTWCKKYWRLINLAGLPLLGVIAAESFCASTAGAQQPLEDRYQKAVQSFNAAKMEDACDLLRQIEKDSPGYKDVRTYLNPACDTTRRIYEQEESLYKQGVDLFKQQQYEEAKQKFQQGRNLLLKHPKYRTEMEEYLKQIDTRVREENLYQQAVQFFNAGQNDEAAKQFLQIEQAKGTRAADARAYLQQIKDRQEAATNKKAIDADQQIFDDAVSAFENKRYADAKARFESVIQKGSPHAAEARSYLQQIDAALRQEATAREKAKKAIVEEGKDPRQVAQQLVTEARTDMRNGQYGAALEKLRSAEILDSANRDVSTMLAAAMGHFEEEPLRLGLEAYFTGKYEQAEQQFDAYVANHGRKIALAHFFRGAAHASRYYLSGEQDRQQREFALADFRASQNDSRQFQPPAQVVAPKILSLYSQAVGTRQP